MSENETALPPLSQDSIARIEHAVFERIEGEQHTPTPVTRAASRRARRRRWVTGLGIAAAFVGGILIAPPLLNAVSPADSGVMSEYDAAVRQEGPIALNGEMAPADGGAADAAAGSSADSATSDFDDGRDIISNAQVTLRVADVSDAADAIGDLAAEHDGYVEATDIGVSPDAVAETHPGPPQHAGSGWISIRVPADDLVDVISALDEEGEVLRSSISRQDVTSTAVDLQARVDAARASVTRLTELMDESGSLGDLIAAESALSERQAQLEVYEQQLKGLDEQVAMATVSVQLTEQTTATKADPAGFTDGLLAGWNGLIVSLNAVVVGIGFLLPWLVIAGTIVLVIWLIRRRTRRRNDNIEPTESA